MDQVSKELPIFILHISGHLACVNSAALELAKISQTTPDPGGGKIGRVANTLEPSGYLEEAGMLLAQAAVMGKIKPRAFDVFKKMQDVYIQHGVTTVQEGAATKQGIQWLKIAAALGLLRVDVVAYPLMSEGARDILKKNRKRNGRYVRRLKIGGYKLILDGSPQGRSAWLTQPYLRGEPDDCGYPWLPNPQVEQYAEMAIEDGQQLLAHCNGDAASEQFLDAYEKALSLTRDESKRRLRPVMIHCQTVRDDQLDRMAEAEMIASIFVGHVYYWGDVHMKNLGEARGERISPARNALDRGIKVNFHQDTPVTKPNMLHTIWCAVNRLSRAGKEIGTAQKISVYEALRAVTIDAAYQYFEEETKGSIAVGKRADLVILDDNPLAVEPMRIKDIKVLETIKDGKVLYRSI